ncbi:MAG: cytochrome d ubiquinol oxidase subunit II [Desulfonauticus sp.]|nr:cytochrome d ubiquinol oxidase subunit II [Desulfonauticus sp.]
MLETIWFLLWGILWAIYFVLDGFDLGLGTIMPCLAKNDTERRIIYNAMGPFWDGNEVWLITAGGVTFAAFPKAYAVMFSGLYTALMLLLIALIIRGVSFEFRNKVDSPGWRKIWDTCLVIGSFLPALLLGVAFANIFKGLPIDKQGIVQGNLFSLLNPYGLVGGILFVLLFVEHGALWLAYRSTGDLQIRSGNMAAKVWPIKVVVLVGFLIYSFLATKLFTNYFKTPMLFLLLILPIGGVILSRVYISTQKWLSAWIASACTIAGTTLFGIVGIYPALLPSSLNPAYSITIYNSASSTLTLQIMLGVVAVFIPLVIGYQFWVYKTFSHPISTHEKLEY